MIEFRNILVKIKQGRSFVAKFRMEMSGADVREVLVPVFKAQAAASGHELIDGQIVIVVDPPATQEHGRFILDGDDEGEDCGFSVTIDVPDSTPS